MSLKLGFVENKTLFPSENKEFCTSLNRFGCLHLLLRRFESLNTKRLTEVKLSNTIIASLSATRGQAFQGDIAIDDLKFVGCALPPIEVCKPTDNKFKCKRGSCIDPDYKCDFNDDCGDYSDEETSLCGRVIVLN